MTLTWAAARIGMPPTQLPAWVSAIQEAHARRPLLAQDQRNLEVALEVFGEPYEWLHPPKESEEGAAEAGAAAQ